jgi:hypothetical protein
MPRTPHQPAPTGQPDAPTQPTDDVIVRAAVHPAIGVARMGNAESAYYVGPEVTTPPAAEQGYYHDGPGALKRQAARFRVYGYNAAGEVVGELTPKLAEIRWTVHVANHKAAWYQWQMALDVPEAATLKLPRRNASVTGADRDALAIDGGAQTVSGIDSTPAEFWGAFQGTKVYLGEISTDEAGRLLFLGGRGRSESPKGTPIFDPNDGDSFINADGWFDDASDGPVTAEVTVGGRAIPVDPAWVLTAPPNYAPDLLGVRTLYDLLYDLYVRQGWLAPPARVSFRHDVYPLLQRLSGLQWVNQGFAVQYGLGGAYAFEDPELVARLARDPATDGFDLYGELRRQVLNAFRAPDGTDNNQLPWPWIYGDAMSVDPIADTPRQNATVTPTQYRTLQSWAAGDFIPDWDVPYTPPATLDDVPMQDRPAMLDRAALEYCLADAFHPGCEVTWPIRHLTMFASPVQSATPYRIVHRPAGVPEPDYGDTLDQQTALGTGGPLYAQGPGDLTRWMGLPWQADTAYCRSGYDADYDPFVPTFWPARVPNQVLTAAGYQVAMDGSRPEAERVRAYTQRTTWTKPLTGTTAEQMEQMVKDFGSMWLLEPRDGPVDDPRFPSVMLVGTTGAPDGEAPKPAPAPLAAPAPQPGVHPREMLRRRAVEEAGWDSHEERRNAPLPVRHPKK